MIEDSYFLHVFVQVPSWAGRHTGLVSKQQPVHGNSGETLDGDPPGTRQTERHPRLNQVEPCPVILQQDQRGGDGGRQGDGLNWSNVTDHRSDRTDVMVSNS